MSNQQRVINSEQREQLNAQRCIAEQPDTDKLKAHACAFAEYVTSSPLVKHSYTNFMAKIEESE